MFFHNKYILTKYLHGIFDYLIILMIINENIRLCYKYIFQIIEELL